MHPFSLFQKVVRVVVVVIHSCSISLPVSGSVGLVGLPPPPWGKILVHVPRPLVIARISGGIMRMAKFAPKGHHHAPQPTFGFFKSAPPWGRGRVKTGGFTVKKGNFRTILVRVRILGISSHSGVINLDKRIVGAKSVGVSHFKVTSRRG